MKKFAILGTIVLLITSVGLPISGIAKEPVVIGSISPLTGTNAVQGNDMKNAEQLAMEEVNAAGGVLGRRLKILFDCYHVHREGGEVLTRFRRHGAAIGHVQIAAAEDRAEPLPGALDYSGLLPAFRAAGYEGAFGCEYRPRGTTEAGLAWREALQRG